ncbi:MAG: glycosyltransferase, partial [Caldilineaceae bacterium]|nr:glycosyltransferase [Caldilineaceae bacterium]
VRNGERYVAEAVESVLAQSYRDFEYLLVDDASTDSTPEIMSRYAAQDDRIVPINISRHVNHSAAINAALAVARGEFVAILDADDIAYPTRLEKQVCFLDAHPDVGVIGAQVDQIDSTGKVRKPMPFPTTCALSRWTILFATPVLHSAAMIRRSLLAQVGGYSVHWRYANDYSLWAELIAQTGITNLPETLVAYRLHEQQISATRTLAQQGEVWLLILRMLAERLSLNAPLNDIGVFYHAVRGVQFDKVADLMCAADLLTTIRERYFVVERPDPATVEEINVDCARRLLWMAWVHRHSHRADSRNLLQRALELDPNLWQRPRTRELLRCNRHNG